VAGIDLRVFDAPDEVREFEHGRFELVWSTWAWSCRDEPRS
jgi:hypothetical protein